MSRQFNGDTRADYLVDLFADHIKGSVILTTGVSPDGLGDHFVQTVARAQPALMIISGRNIEKPQKIADSLTTKHPSIKIRVLELGLGSLEAVCKSATTVNSWADVPYIDVLVNNAGIMAVPYKISPEGFESSFATNHLGHFLFTNLIMDKVMASKAPRVVNVSSHGHRLNPMRWDDINFDGGKTYNKWQAYGQSKTANMLFSLSLAKKPGPKGLLAFSVHPGVINNTTLGTHIDWSVDFEELRNADKLLGNRHGWAESFTFKEPHQGVATHVYAAYSPDLKDNNGAYLQDSRVADPYTDVVKPWTTSPIEADRLWKLSEKCVDQQFSY